MKRNLFTVWAKRTLPALALAVAMLPACKPEPEPNPEPLPEEPEENPYEGPMDSVQVLTYTRKDGWSLQYNNVMKYANDPRVI